MQFKSKIYISYDDVQSMCQYLEDEVARFKPDVIVGIVRGGLLPALHFSHALDRPLITIQWQTRDGAVKQLDNALVDMIKSGRHVVFVDDINDSGTTFAQIAENYGRPSNVRFVSLIEKVSSEYPSDNSALKIDDERWVVFPYERS